MARVAIFGGGVAGLTAALELVERGYEVSVYEARHWGGKIRSMGKPNTGVDGRQDLPGEHGFHFFPTFYRNVPHTMGKIPRPRGGTVLDNLVEGSRELIASEVGPPILVPSHLPSSLRDWEVFVRALASASAGISPAELAFFAERTLTFMTACDARRIAVYDHISWWDFLRADEMSYAYQQLLVRLPTLLLIAVHPRKASARTMGNALISMLRAGFLPFNNVERSLDGPPSDKWVDPWVAHLGKRAEMVLGAELKELVLGQSGQSGPRITSARITMDGQEREIQADYYLCALPVEVMARIITPDIIAAAPSMAGIPRLSVAWMNGLQYFLDRPFPVCNGHVAYEDSAWAITSVSQAQFWSGVDLADYGDGRLREVFSVIISDWEAPGTEVVFKPARECSEEELFIESLAQIQAGLSRSGLEPLRREYIFDWMADPDITYPWAPPAMGVDHADTQRFAGPPGVNRSQLICAGDFAELQCQDACGEPGINQNAEPLFISTVGVWELRPEATTEIANLFLASDYIKTSIDFAAAEGADEAGRKAANGILSADGSGAPRVKVWGRQDPLALLPLLAVDAYRFERGLPQLELPEWLRSLVPRIPRD